jgi:hypothetical protein
MVLASTLTGRVLRRPAAIVFVATMPTIPIHLLPIPWIVLVVVRSATATTAGVAVLPLSLTLLVLVAMRFPSVVMVLAVMGPPVVPRSPCSGSNSVPVASLSSVKRPGIAPGAIPVVGLLPAVPSIVRRAIALTLTISFVPCLIRQPSEVVVSATFEPRRIVSGGTGVGAPPLLPSV